MNSFRIGFTSTTFKKKTVAEVVEIAKKAGVTQSTVSLWERGVTRPTVTLLPKLAQVYGVSMEELAGESKQKTEDAK